MMEISSHSKSITGVRKPNAGLLDIAPAPTSCSDHCYVMIAGTNDVAAERQDSILDHIEAVLQQCRENSTVLVCPLTPKHDLPPTTPFTGSSLDAIVISRRHVTG